MLAQILESSNYVSSQRRVLLIVLLSLRSCYKENIHASTAELLYKRTLRIPGEFFDHKDMLNDPQFFIEPFRRFIQRIRPIPTTQQIVRNKPFRYKDLHACFSKK